jgi:hypothetical protein
LDRLEQLTAQLQSSLAREASDHPFDGSDVHLDSCLACLDRFVELRDAVYGIAAPQPVSRRLVRKLDELQGVTAADRLRTRLIDGLRRAFVIRVPAWAFAGMAAALVILTWAATQHIYHPAIGVQWPLPDPTRPDPLRPAHGQGARTVTGIVSSVQDATSHGVDAHVLSLTDASGATYVLFTWGRPTVRPGDMVEIEALFASIPQQAGPPVYQGLVTELRHAK